MTSDTGFWNNIAAKYAKSPIRDEAAYAQTLTRVQAHLEPGHRVLELGAGTGSTALRLAPFVAQITVTDIAENMLEVARARAAAAEIDTIRFQICEATQAPEGPFDVVMGFNLMHLLPARSATYAAASERLVAGGLFITKTPCLGERRNRIKYWLFRALVPLMQLAGKAPSHVAFLDVATLEQEIREAGFEIVETGNFPDDLPSRFVVARRL